MEIHKILVEIFKSGPKQGTYWQSRAASMAINSKKIYIQKKVVYFIQLYTTV